MSDCPWLMVATHILAFIVGGTMGILATALGVATRGNGEE